MTQDEAMDIAMAYRNKFESAAEDYRLGTCSSLGYRVRLTQITDQFASRILHTSQVSYENGFAIGESG